MPDGQTENVLELKGVGWSVGGMAILNKVDACLKKGEFVALIGPNGAGKSSLLRAIAGLLPEQTGQISLLAKPLENWSRPELACQMAYLPQLRAPSVPLSVHDVVAMGRYAHRGAWRPLKPLDRQAVDEAMERLEIQHLRQRDTSTLSGGELQRCLLARCIAQGSPLLVLDEPLTGLDIGHQLQLLELLEGFVAEGRTVLWSVHDLRLAAEHAGEIWLLHQGQLVRSGPATSILQDPRTAEIFGVRIEAMSGGEGWRFSGRSA